MATSIPQTPPPRGPFGGVRRSDLALPLGLVGILGLMILTLPALVLDLLLAINITISLVILLTAVNIRRALDFSVFPSLLLISTLFRLALNISSTRLILLDGAGGTEAAGDIIDTFGTFVVGGSYVVGIVVFLIITLINFIVITKGSSRIAEVSARFTLDALPGKQMSIDSDLASGLISQDEARRRRTDLANETDFYGAMDGASKFVRGDAIAGLVITAINIVGGLVIGVAQEGMSVSSAAETYTILTIGDGLVSQIPTLLISTAAGIVVTRSADSEDLTGTLGTQIFRSRRVLVASALVLGTLVLVPGMPILPFLALITLLLFLARNAPPIPRPDAPEAPPGEPPPGEGPDGPISEEEELARIIPVEDLELQVGYSLVPLLDAREGGDLVNRIAGLRRNFARDLGIILPPVHLRDNLDLSPGEYRLYLHGVELASGMVMADRLMAMDPGDAREPIEAIGGGIDTTEPAFGLPASWIRAAHRARAELAGYTVVEPVVIIVTHLSEALQREADKLLDRQGLDRLLDIVAERRPKVVDELLPGVLTHAELLSVLRALLRERVGIRDLQLILETIAEIAPRSRATSVLVKHVRRRLGPSITQSLTTDDVLHTVILDAASEDTLRGVLVRGDDEDLISPDLATAQRLVGQLSRGAQTLAELGYPPVLLAPSDLRYPLWRFGHRFVPQLTVLANDELPSRVTVRTEMTLSIGRPRPPVRGR